MMCRVVGGARAVDGQAECFEDQILADVFGLESGVATEGSCSLVLYCCCCCFLTLTDPLRIQPWSQDRRNQTKSNRESEMSMGSIQKRTGKK